MHFIVRIISIVFVALIWSSCSNPEMAHSGDSKRPLLVATTTHLADLAQQIGGEYFEVKALMRPGVDPHSYRATAHDISLLHRADLVLFHGLLLEGKLARVLEGQSSEQRTHFSPCHRIPKNQLIMEEDQNTTVDPHLWFSPTLWKECGSLLRDKLCEMIPERKTHFQANFLAFEKSVNQIDQWAKEAIYQIPESARVLITSHDAFRYFGKHFQIRVVALQGINTNVEAGLSDRSRFTSLIRQHNSPALFIESSVNPKALKQIAKETGAVLGGTLFSDALGPNDQWIVGPDGKSYSKGTWQGMMLHNVSTIEEALRKTL